MSCKFGNQEGTRVGPPKAYRLQLWYPGESLFFPTSHTSDDIDVLWPLAAADVFRGCRTRIVDEAGVVRCEPPVRGLVTDPTAPGPVVRKLWLPDGGSAGAEPGAAPDTAG